MRRGGGHPCRAWAPGPDGHMMCQDGKHTVQEARREAWAPGRPEGSKYQLKVHLTMSFLLNKCEPK